ncbi:MAG: alpha/beta hydrolase [Actinobacteria bacterium]|nr:alpha/beta hydrolase [Actinomycetota bacterium]
MGLIRVATDKGEVSAAWTAPRGAVATLAVAPGAGSGFDAPFLVGLCDGLAERGVASLRFNFVYQEQGRRSPDREAVLRSTWLAAFDETRRRSRKGVPVLAGGKSMGGRYASMCTADGMTADGLVFLGYPLHPPKDPDKIRDAHLYGINVPMLFLQGTRDPFARTESLEPVLRKLGKSAVYVPTEGGDHSFRVKGGTRDDHAIGATLAEPTFEFIQGLL